MISIFVKLLGCRMRNVCYAGLLINIYRVDGFVIDIKCSRDCRLMLLAYE